MKPYHQYWTFSAIRGVMTLLASVAILTIPQAAASMLSIPVFLLLAVDCLAAYSFFDAAVMVLLGKLLPARAKNLKVLYVQALMAISTGGLLFLVVYGVLNLRWLVWIVAAQAALAALAEFAVARDTHQEYRCLSCYTTVIILAVSAICLPFAGGLSATGMSLALATYVGAYGSSELALGARMLFVEYRNQHPAERPSEAWQLEMFRPPIAALLSIKSRKLAAAAVMCESCPASPLCLDSSLAAQLAGVMAQHVPALVRSSRVETVLAIAARAVAA